MTKIQFLLSLHEKLAGYPKEEVEERLRFYSEMIEDRMEEGLSEEDAVAAAGSVDQIAAQIAAEMTSVTKEKKRRQRSAGEIVLLVLGFPVWLPLLIAVFAVIFSLYVSLWAVIISLWTVFASLIACAVAAMVFGIGMLLASVTLPGIAMIGAGFLCVGLGIFLFFGCKAATKGVCLLTKKFFLQIKSHFHKKEAE